MRVTNFVALILIGILIPLRLLVAQTVVPTVTSLRLLSLGTNATIILKGWHVPADGGGGILVSDATANICQQSDSNGSTSSGSTTVNVPTTSPLWPYIALNMPISGLGIPVPDYVTGFIPAAGKITIKYAAVGTGSGITITINGDNGGTSFVDATGDCFHRISPNYSPKEWGAYMDGASDDTFALQNWLNSNQPHIGIPGTSVITQALLCANPNGYANYNGSLEGPVPSGIGPGVMAQPSFEISAPNTLAPTNYFFNNAVTPFTGMLNMIQSQCSLSGVWLNGNATSTNQYDNVDAYAHSNSVFNHSLLQGGFVGFKCNQAGADIQVYDTSIANTLSDGISCGSPNSKFQRNVIYNVGNGAPAGLWSGNAISLSQSTQTLIESNIIEQSTGSGISCHNSAQTGIVGNYFDNNGNGLPQTANVRVNQCDGMSISGNQFHHSSGYDEMLGNNTADVMFQGPNDSVSLAGNEYFQPSNTSNNAWYNPDYEVEFLNSGTLVTNFNFADTPTPLNKGTFGPNALAAIGPLGTFHVAQNYISGLVTSNFGGAANQMLNIGSGEASDSLNVQTMDLPANGPGPACQVNLGMQGNRGLDTGGSVAPGTQYNFFIFAQGGYSTGVSCIASRGTAPNFVAAFPHPTGGINCTTSLPIYLKAVQANVNSGSQILLNVTSEVINSSLYPLAGFQVGDSVADCDGYISGATIGSTSSGATSFTGTLNISSPCITSVSSVANLYQNELIQNSNFFAPPNPATYIVGFNTATCPGSNEIQMNQNPASSAMATTIQASTALTITIAGSSATGSTPPGVTDTIYVYNDRYRMIAALYTDMNSDIQSFMQNDDTFYLGKSGADVNSTISNTPIAIHLASVPTAISVEALGRCVANNRVHLFGNGLAPGTPALFPVSPGYDTQSPLAPETSFGYRIYTDLLGNIYGQGTPSVLQCMTDGWVWHRGK